MHDEWRYEKNSDDTFTFKCGDDIIIESIDEVWVVVDNHAGIESPVLLKHGSKEKLHKIYDDMVPPQYYDHYLTINRMKILLRPLW